MTLGIRRTASRKVRLLATFMAVFAFVVQPYAGMTFGDTVSAAPVTPVVCTYDFTPQKMWEVTWGYGFEDRNGGAPIFTPSSHGGLVTINGNPTTWNDYHLYVTEGNNRHVDYGFADGTIRTVDVTFSEVDGCQIPTIVWGFGEPVLDSFPSTNASNKLNSHHYVEQVSATDSSVTLRFVNPTNFAQYFEYRKDNAASSSTAKYGPCRIGVTPLSSGCQGKRYLAADDLSYPSQAVPANSSIVKTYDVAEDVAIRVTFGPERNWDFDWTSFVSEVDPTNSHTFSVGGWVFNNKNSDRDQDAGEEKLAGWDVKLYKENSVTWTQVASDTTDGNGIYQFPQQQEAGTYYVCETKKAGWTQTKQDWSGTPFHVVTANASPNASAEGQWCAMSVYTDVADKGWATRLGNVDTGKPTGLVTYTGGIDVSGVRYIKNIDDLSFVATIDDNHSVVRATYTVTKLNTTTNTYEGFCGNWNSSSSSSYNLGGGNQEQYIAGIKNCAANPANWTDGTYRIGHAGYDTAGNEGKFNTQRQLFVIDSVAPDAQITAPTAGIVAGSVTISGTASNDTLEYNLVVKDSSNTVVYGPGSVSGNTIADLNWDTTSFANGTYTILLEVRDRAGNQDAGSVAIKTVTVDNQRPVVTINNVPNSTASIPVTISGTINDPDATLALFVNGFFYTTIMNDGTGGWSYELPAALLNEGSYTLLIVATDTAGNDSDMTSPGSSTTLTVGPFANATPTSTDAPSSLNTFTALGTGQAASVFRSAVISESAPSDSDAAVLGTQDGVKSPSETAAAIAPSAQGWKFFGLAWYWWLLIAAVIAGIWWFFAPRWRTSKENL